MEVEEFRFSFAEAAKKDRRAFETEASCDSSGKDLKTSDMPSRGTRGFDHF
jgi:hypothetical protein